MALFKLGKYAEAHSALKESVTIDNELGFHGGLAASLLHEAEKLLIELEEKQIPQAVVEG